MEVAERSLVFRIGKIVLVEFGEKPGSSEPPKDSAVPILKE